MKAFVMFAAALALALVSAADSPVVSTHTSGSVTCTVTQDTSQPASTGLTAYIVTLSSAASIYSVDGRIDATSGYLNQSWFMDSYPTPVADDTTIYVLLTPQQKLDDTTVLVPLSKMMTYSAPSQERTATTQGTTLCGVKSAGDAPDVPKTMIFGFQGLSSFTSIPLARVVLNNASVAQFKFAICDGNKVKGTFDFAIPGQ